MKSLQSLLGALRSAASSKAVFSDDPEERGVQRHHRAALAGITAAAARIVQVGTSLVTVPLLIRYLGTERFGLWMTISSVLVMAGFADLGLGNGLLNIVAKAQGRDDHEAIRRAVSSGFASLSAISAMLLALFFSIYQFVPWADFFGVTSPRGRVEAGPALCVFTVCFALNLPADVVQKTQMGLQQGFRTSIWDLAGSAMGLVGVVIGVWLHAGLPILICALAGAPLVAVSCNWIVFFFITRSDLRPRWKLVSSKTIKQILSIGILFLALQVVVAVAFSADSLLIARTKGAVNVPEYAIPQRMFSLITIMITMFVTPLWPAYGEAIARRDRTWVKRAVSRSLSTVFLVAAAASILLLLSSRWLISWWAGPAVNPPVLLLVGLCVWTIMDSCGNALAIFLNGSGLMHAQIIWASVFGVTCLAAKIYVLGHFGLSGIPWATITTWGVFNLLPLLVYLRWKLRRMGELNPESLPAVND